MEREKKEKEYSIFVYKLNKNNQFNFLNQFIINPIENETIEFLIDFISYFYYNNCICKFKIFEMIEGDGFFYSDLNETPKKKIKDCFKNNIIYILRNDQEECKCDLEYKKLLKYSKREIIIKLIEIKKELKNISSMNKQFESKINENTNIINNFKKLLTGKEKLINFLKNKLNEMKTKIINTEELNNDLILHSIRKEEEYKKLSNNINNKNLELKNSKIANSQRNTFNDLNFFIENDEKTCKYYSNKKSVDFYDIIVNIESVKDINKGWEIKMNKRGEENYKLYKNKKILKIGVIGNANKGKSYLLSKISKIDLPSGTSIRTEGLSIKYPELEHFKNRKIALLDSAGLETPVLKECEEDKEISKELFREKSREKLITELFLQRYIIYYSDILILVVGILTYSEQKLLNRIKTEIQTTKLNKPLFIIHNLNTYVNKEQVKDYINDYLLKSATFDLVKGHKISTKIIDEDFGEYYYEKNSELKIFHLIFANENSEAGIYYNNFTLNFLNNAFLNVTDLQTYDVIDTIKERFITLSKEIIDYSKNTSILSIDDILNNKEIIKEKRLRLKNNIKLQLKKCYIDEIGFSRIKNNGYDPPYSYYKLNNNIIIQIECPGDKNTINSDYNYLGEYLIITIKGIKKKDNEPEKLEDNIFNKREFGDFCIDIYLKSEDYRIKNKTPEIEFKYGIISVKYKLEDKINKIYTFVNDEEI